LSCQHLSDEIRQASFTALEDVGHKSDLNHNMANATPSARVRALDVAHSCWFTSTEIRINNQLTQPQRPAV
jgi:hypothetical protein